MARLPIFVMAVLFFVAPIEPAAQERVSTNQAEVLSYPGLLSQGHRAALSGDDTRALERYEAAKDMKPGEAEAYYFIGYAQGRLGRFEEAFATLATARSVSGKKNADFNGKLLFLRAFLEEKRGDLQAAEKAWTKYLGFAQTHAGARVFPETAKSRLEAIKNKQRIDEQYVEVRKRIEAQ